MTVSPCTGAAEESGGHRAPEKASDGEGLNGSNAKLMATGGESVSSVKEAILRMKEVVDFEALSVSKYGAAEADGGHRAPEKESDREGLKGVEDFWTLEVRVALQ